MRINVIASGSKGNCYILSGARDVLLIEAGVPKKRILEGLNHDISNVAGVLVSHEHMDHAMAMDDLLRLRLEVFASKGTFGALGTDQQNRRIVEPNKPVSIGEFNVLPFLVQHDAAEPLGFLIESVDLSQRIVFATDTYFLKYRFKSIDCFMVEANYDIEVLDRNVREGKIHPRIAKRAKHSHFEISDVEAFLMASELGKTRKIMLLHTSENNSEPEVFRDRISRRTGIETLVAETGLLMEF